MSRSFPWRAIDSASVTTSGRRTKRAVRSSTMSARGQPNDPIVAVARRAPAIAVARAEIDIAVRRDEHVAEPAIRPVEQPLAVDDPRAVVGKGHPPQRVP